MLGNFDSASFDNRIGGFDSDTVPFTGGGALWAKGRGKLKLRRPLTYSETEELRLRLQAIAAEKAVQAIPMSTVPEGNVIADDDDDDLILQAAWRLLH